VDCWLLPELVLVGDLRLKSVVEGLRVKSELLACMEEVLRLDVILLDELLDDALLGREMLGLVVLLKAVKPEDLEVLDLVEGLKVLDLVEDLRVLDLVEGLNVLDLMEELLDRVGLPILIADDEKAARFAGQGYRVVGTLGEAIGAIHAHL